MHVVKIVMPENPTDQQWEDAMQIKIQLKENNIHGIIINHPDYQAVDVQALTVKS